MKKQKVSTLVHFILDASGSMGSILYPTINGFNEYVQGLKTSKDKFRFSLTLFDSLKVEQRYTNVPIKEVQPLNEDTFRPGAATPLYDAVIDSVEKLYEEVKKSKDPIIVAIMTDGEENSSVNHDAKCLKDLVERLQSKGNWTFVYMGANQDAWANAASYGIAAGNTMSWNSTAAGTQDAFRGMAMSTANYSASISGGGAGGGSSYSVKNFFKPEDVKKDEK